jgi:hypothetical protein
MEASSTEDHGVKMFSGDAVGTTSVPVQPDESNELHQGLTEETPSVSEPNGLKNDGFETLESLTAPALSQASDTGLSTTDQLTSDVTPEFTGRARGEARVELVADEQVLGFTTADVQGRWQFLVPSDLALQDGSYEITAREIDQDKSIVATSDVLMRVYQLLLRWLLRRQL